MAKENERFKQFAMNRLKKLFDEVLYNSELAVRSDYQYQILRKRILRSGNNALRDIVSEVDFYVLTEDERKARKTEMFTMDEGEGNERN